MTGRDLSLAKVYESTTLIPVNQVVSLLEAEISLDKVADFSVKIEAVRRYDSQNSERRNYWGELAIWSTRRLGELIRIGQEKKVLADKNENLKQGPKLRCATSGVSLTDIGIEKTQSARAQKIAKIPAKKVNEYVKQQKASGEEVSKAGVIRFATGTEKAGTAAHVSKNTGCPEWYTPAEYLEAARSVLGTIQLDPASSAIAQKSVKAKRFYTIDNDGLSKKWKGTVWMNPPYSVDLCSKFIDKLCEHVETGDVPQAILLVNNATETKWFQQAARCASAICFPAVRVKFLDENGNSGAPLQGQAVLYFGKAARDFSGEFSDFGFCVTVRKTK